MDDALVQQCGGHGVDANGTGVVGRCTNVEVRQCRWSGVLARKGAIDRCQDDGAPQLYKRKHHEYGLAVYWFSSSTIQLVSPLTKEQVSLDNGGGGNWGALFDGDINQLKTIPPLNVPSNETTTVSYCGVRICIVVGVVGGGGFPLSLMSTF